MKKTIVDLHTHITDGYDIIINPMLPVYGGWNFRGLAQPSNRVAERLLSHCFSQPDNTLVGIISFNDDRANGTIDRLREVAWDLGFEAFGSKELLRVTSGEKLASFVAGQEIPTNKGHVLIVGALESIGERYETQDIGRVLKTARDDGALILGDHVLGPKSISLDRKTVEQFREYFDAINVWDGNFGPKLHKEQLKLAQDLEIPSYVASDSHTIKAVLSSATRMQVDPSNLYTFRESTRKALKDQSDVDFVYGSNGSLEKIRHVASCMVSMAGLKTGLLKRENQ